MIKAFFIFVVSLLVPQISMSQALILPQPNPPINYKSSKYRGIFKNPEVMRRYMIDFSDEYVRLYMKEFFEKNPEISKEIFPSIKEIIRDNQLLVRGLPSKYIMAFSKRAAELQKTQMDKMIKAYVTADVLNRVDKKVKLINDNINPMKLLVNDLGSRVKNLESIAGLGSGAEVDLPSNKNMQKELIKLAEQVKRLKNMVIASNRPEINKVVNSNNSAQSWVAWAALGVALLSLLLSFSKK